MGKAKKVVVVGGLNLDIQAKSERAFRLGDSNPGRSFRNSGGVGRNIAENLVRLGLSVELIAATGDDEASAWLLADCARKGIGLSGLLRLKASSASQYICLLDSDGRLVGAVADMAACDELTPSALEARSSLLEAADLIVVDANLPAASIEWLASRFGKPRGGPLLCLDPVSAAKARKAAPCIGSFDFAKPNLVEASVLAGENAPEPLGMASSSIDAVGLSGAVDRLSAAASLGSRLRGLGLGEAFVSLGAEGLYYEGYNRSGKIERGCARLGYSAPAPLNVSGAGDAACALLVWGRLEGLGASERSGLALAAAALTAASEATVNPCISLSSVSELSKGVTHERLS